MTATSEPGVKTVDVLAALDAGLYRVDPDTGTVTGRTGKPLSFLVKPSGRRFVRLHVGGRVRSIAVARLAWISVTRHEIPAGFEIHHDDLDNANDAWGNLICLHAMDHRKKHQASDVDVPF